MAGRRSLIAAQDASGAILVERDGCVAASVYTTIEQEYRCVRERVGIQDLTYYGKLMVSGDAALDLINRLILTDLARLPINQLQSSFMLDDDGRPVCELLIANLGTQYLLISEGADPAAIEARLRAEAANHPGVVVADLSLSIGMLSVDGPYSWELLKAFLGLGVIGTRYLEVVSNQIIDGVEVTMCRAGKTGEYGYLLFGAAEQIPALWKALMTAGERFDMLPIGYAAVDLCKMENRNTSQHREGSAVGNVLELNTRTMVGRYKDDHVGRTALQTTLEQGVSRRVVGMMFQEALPPEQDDIATGIAVKLEDRSIGSLVNVGYSYALKRWIGLGLIDEEFACVGVDYNVQTERGALAVSTVSAPFLFNRSLTIRPQEDSYFA